MPGAWLIAVALLGVARAQGDRSAGGPPPEAFSACKDLALEARCSFSTPIGTMSGACVQLREGTCCIPDNMRPPGMGRGRTAGGTAQESRDERPPWTGEGSERPEWLKQRMAEEARAQAAPQAEPAAAAPTPVAPTPAAPAPVPVAAPKPSGGNPPVGAFVLGAGVFGLGMYVARRRGDAAAAGPPGAMTAPAPAVQATRPPTGPRLLARQFQLGREIGRGGMGIVYEARDMSLDRRVAIKELSPEVAQDPRGRERFLAEAKTVARLSHPNIVTIHSILEEPEGLYLVFEYVEGETVSALLARRQRLQPAEAFSLLEKAAEAVDYAHGERVIHRDLKPGNIMVDRAGRPKVMDFGIAHQAKMTVSRLTRTAAVGTMAYMPPEQEMGEAVRESDVFSFAALSYEALTGELPFAGPNFYQQKMTSFFRRPSAMGLSEAADPVFERAFEPEPKQRWATAGEFVTRLKEAA